MLSIGNASPIMAKQARQRALALGPSTSLLDLWRGDLSEVIAAFLPLKAIATMPVSRRSALRGYTHFRATSQSPTDTQQWSHSSMSRRKVLT